MDLLDLVVKIKGDDSGLQNTLGNVASGLGKFGLVAAKGVGIAVGAAAAGVTALTKSAVGAYSEYQQLEGGVKKLYGNMGMSLEDYAESVGKKTEEIADEWKTLGEAQDLVMKNARDAYKTTGMDMNTYMNTATSFSAALISSLEGDTVKAAEQTQVAMQAISDNFNTFGGDIGMIQGAFQGFAKQNYTMLDNLKLGYGGTKKEMERLIADANEYAASIGMASDLSIESFSDVVTAIDLIQQKQHIAGTTGREAGSTIEGSMMAARAAWQNLLIDLGSGDMEAISADIENVVKSASTAFENLLPTISNALKGIGALVRELLPKALELIPTLIKDVLPDIMAAATELVQGLVTAMTENMDTISDVINQVIEAIITLLPDVMKLGGEIVSTLAKAILDNLDSILDAGLKIAMQLMEGLQNNADKIFDGAQKIIDVLVTFFTENIEPFTEAAVGMIAALVEGLAEHVDEIINGAIQIVLTLTTALFEHLPEIVQAGLTLLEAIVQGIIENLPMLIDALPQLIQTIIDSLLSSFDLILDASIQLFMAILEALPTIIERLTEALPDIVETVIDGLISEMDLLLEASVTFFNALIEALPRILPKLIQGINELVNKVILTLLQKLPGLLDVGKKLFGKLVDAIPDTISKLTSRVPQIISAIVSALRNGFNAIKSVGGNLLQGLWNGISDKIGWITGKIRGMGSQIISAIKGVFGVASPSKVFAEIGGFLAEGLGVGWDNEIDAVMNDMSSDLSVEASAKVGGRSDDVTRIIEYLERYLPGMGDWKVQMETGAVVGQIVRPMDRALGELANMNARMAY